MEEEGKVVAVEVVEVVEDHGRMEEEEEEEGETLALLDSD